MAELAALARAARPRLGPVRLVCIDGPAGSGKTTLAGRLAAALRDAAPPAAGGSSPGDRSEHRPEPGAAGVVVVHLDDLYEGWAGLDGVWERLTAQVLDPLADGRPGRYQRYDWVAGRFDDWVDVPVPEVLVVEGCGSAPRAADGRTVLRVWVEAPAASRLRRGLERDGEAMRTQWVRWMDLEAAHFRREDTRRRADALVDGTRPLEP
ncbi:MAG: uridine kinase [Actinotalea sp.]|nr:uridine kinase [Actinotalea sp.]